MPLIRLWSPLTFSSAQDSGRLWQLLWTAVNWIIMSVAGPAFSSLPCPPPVPFLSEGLHCLGSDVWGCSSTANKLELSASLQSMVWDRPLLPGTIELEGWEWSSLESFAYSQLFPCWPQSLMILLSSPRAKLNFVLVWGENNLLYPSPSERGN